VKELLESHLNGNRDRSAQDLLKALEISPGTVVIQKNYPPTKEADDSAAPAPYLTIIFDASDRKLDDPAAQMLARDFVKTVLGQSYFSQSFVEKLKQNGEMSDDGLIKEKYLFVKVGMTPEGPPGPFDIPRGLSLPYLELLTSLGYLPSPNHGLSVAFTPNFCQESAIRAIQRGMYSDAIALSNHGLRYFEGLNSSLLYLRAYSEISLTKSDEALATLKVLRPLNPVPAIIRERVNGPAAIQLMNALEQLRNQPPVK
jgi:hypothetical protein